MKVSRASGTKGRRDPAVPGRYSPFRFFVSERAPRPAPPRPRVVAAHLLPSLPARVSRGSPSLLSLSLQWHQLVTGFSLHLFYFFSSKLFFLLSLDFEALYFGPVLHVLFCCCCFFLYCCCCCCRRRISFLAGKLGSVKRRVNQRTLLTSNRCMYQRETLLYRCLLLPAAVDRTSFRGRAGGRADGRRLCKISSGARFLFSKPLGGGYMDTDHVHFNISCRI